MRWMSSIGRPTPNTICFEVIYPSSRKTSFFKYGNADELTQSFNDQNWGNAPCSKGFSWPPGWSMQMQVVKSLGASMTFVSLQENPLRSVFDIRVLIFTAYVDVYRTTP